MGTLGKAFPRETCIHGQGFLSLRYVIAAMPGCGQLAQTRPLVGCRGHNNKICRVVVAAAWPLHGQTTRPSDRLKTMLQSPHVVDEKSQQTWALPVCEVMRAWAPCGLLLQGCKCGVAMQKTAGAALHTI